MPATVTVVHVIKVPFRLGDIINESVEVLHGRLGPVTSAFTAVKGGQDEDWPLQLKTARCSNCRVQFGDDVIHCVVLPSLLLGMLQVNCTAVFGHSWSEQGWPFDTQGSDSSYDCVERKTNFSHEVYFNSTLASHTLCCIVLQLRTITGSLSYFSTLGRTRPSTR